jgi:hypothetical protein
MAFYQGKQFTMNVASFDELTAAQILDFGGSLLPHAPALLSATQADSFLKSASVPTPSSSSSSSSSSLPAAAKVKVVLLYNKRVMPLVYRVLAAKFHGMGDLSLQHEYEYMFEFALDFFTSPIIILPVDSGFQKLLLQFDSQRKFACSHHIIFACAFLSFGRRRHHVVRHGCHQHAESGVRASGQHLRVAGAQAAHLYRAERGQDRADRPRVVGYVFF